VTAQGLLFGHPSSRAHDPREHLAEHPDTPERIGAIERALAAENWLGWERRDAPAASYGELQAVHDPAMINRIAELCAFGAIDADTFVGEAAGRAAYHAAAAQLSIAGLDIERVFVLDFDVHHGNGTAEMFRYRSDVLFASIHQSGIYPGSDGELWLSLLEHVILRAAAEFGPELVLISAGFDAHCADPLGGCRLETADFAQMTCHVRDLARQVGAPIGAVLEGGYDLEALPAGMIAMMRALAGEGETISSTPEAVYTSRAAAHIGHYWEL
jgi:acetoin utilization deacetylase AcuC-like enzyme